MKQVFLKIVFGLINCIKTYRRELLLILLIIIGYWQVSFFFHPLKFDMIDQYYPWRFFISDCLRHGELPVWLPYQRTGYPIHGEFASGVWYPIAWIIGYIRLYDLYALHFEFLLHIAIGALGFYHLCKSLSVKAEIAFVAAMAYSFSGVFVGNAQHITIIISAAWLPFILSNYIKLLKRNQIKYAVYTALFLYLGFAGGYFAITAITFYVLIGVFVLFSYQLIVKKDFKKWWLSVRLQIVMVFVFILLSAVLFASIYYSLPLISRASALDLDLALLYPFSPQSTISFILPFVAVNSNMTPFDTDLSMSNAYFGAILFLIMLINLSIERKWQNWLFFIMGCFALTIAFGNYLPLRKLLYDYVPLMNLFRFPSIFRLFTIIGFLIFAAFGLQNIVLSYEKYKKTIFFYLVIISFLLLLSILTVFYNNYLEIKNIDLAKLFEFNENLPISSHFILQASFLLLILTFLLIVLRFLKGNRCFVFVSVLIYLELIVATRLSSPYTIVYDKIIFKDTYQYSKGFIEAFPIPKLNPVFENTESAYAYKCYWKNTNIFFKNIGWEGYDSYVLNNYNQIADSCPKFFNKILNNPVVYMADTIILGKKDIEKCIDAIKTSKIAYFSNNIFENTGYYKKNKGDTLQIDKFNPSNIKIWTKSKFQNVLILLQSWSPGWKAYSNSKEIPIYKVNINYMAAVVPAGESTISFHYEPMEIKVGLIISILSFCGVVAYLVVTQVVKKRTVCQKIM